MADSESRKMKKSNTKKRKTRLETPGNEPRGSAKSIRTEEGGCSKGKGEEAGGEAVDSGLQWRNLELLLSIQSKELHAQKKVELVYDYVNWKAFREMDNAGESWQTVSTSRLIVNVSNWIQSVLISSEKESRPPKEEYIRSEETQLFLDFRCWEIFRFCLEESLKHHVPLSLSRDMLRVICSVVRSMTCTLNAMSANLKDLVITHERFKLYNAMHDCMKSTFASHGGVVNANLGLWRGAVDSVLELVTETLTQTLEGCEIGTFSIELSCSVLEPFAKFLKVHPCNKGGFSDFLDNLFESLLRLLGLLLNNPRSNSQVWTHNLVKLIEEVLSCGLFHPVHMDEFMGLHSSEKYKNPTGESLKESKTVIRSYHRHLFEKLEEIISGRNISALGGAGELLRLFANQVKKQKKNLSRSEGSRPKEIKSQSSILVEPSTTSNLASDKNYTLNSSMRKSIFDFFVQTLEPLLDVKLLFHSELEIGASLLMLHQILKSINMMLVSLTCEEVYIRTEDASGGACLNFFKVIYDWIMSYCAQLIQLWLSCDPTGFQRMDLVVLVAEELVSSLSYFLDIAHEVMGDNPVATWLVILCFLIARHQIADVSEVCLLTSRIIDLGCQLVNIYSELRRVSHAVFALTQGLRLITINQSGDADEIKYSLILSLSPIHCKAIAKSARLLLCSQKFRQTVHDAVKNIPEGQASGCIQTLTEDIEQSLNWIEAECSVENGTDPLEVNHFRFSLKAELLGVVLSEIYCEVLDSLAITAGNSNLAGVSMNNLLMVLRFRMSPLVASEQYRVDELSIMGKSLGGETNSGVFWIVLLFFRLYVSCRSLFRQAISFMPPVSSRKMASLLGDLFTVYSGKDIIDRSILADEGYFSWICQPSASLLNIIEYIKNLLQSTSADCAPLIYAMYFMALQRVADLNRLIKSTKYLMVRDNNLSKGNPIEEKESCRKWEMLESVLREEASSIADFLVDQEQLLSCQGIVGSLNDSSVNHDNEINSWGKVVCSVNKRTLPTAIWWLICRNTDIWGNFASKKTLGLFLSTLLQSALQDIGKEYIVNPDKMEVTIRQISLELLHDTSFYELEFVRRYMASRFCLTLQKAVSDMFKDSQDIDGDLSWKPDWDKVLSSLESSKDKESFKDKLLFPHISSQAASCKNLLNLLCHLPKRSFSIKSFSLYARYMLNLERFIVFSFLETDGISNASSQWELLRLLVSSRRTLRSLVVAFCEENNEATKSSTVPIFCKKSFSFVWLLNSINSLVRKQKILFRYGDVQCNNLIASMRDHTSHVFFTLSRYHFDLFLHSLMDTEGDSSKPGSRGVNACKRIKAIAELLSNQTVSLNLSLNESSRSVKEYGLVFADLSNVSLLMSCIQRFLWGLGSTLNNTGAGSFKLYSRARSQDTSMMAINHCIATASEFMDLIFQMLLINDGQPFKSSISGGSILSSYTGNDSSTSNLCSISSDNDSDSDTATEKARSASNNGGQAVNVLTEHESSFQETFRKKMSQCFLNGEDLDKAYCLRELYLASAAIIRLNVQMKFSDLSSGTLQAFSHSSQVLLMEFTRMVKVPEGFSFVWLDGPVKFMEELGAKLSFTDPTKTGDDFSRLVMMHLRAIGKCISLEQKKATLESHERESAVKSLRRYMEAFELSDSHALLKAKLRMSFKMLIKNSSELHFVSVMQALERALIDVHETSALRYESTIGNSDGGAISSIVAAGIDCLDLIVDYVSGQKRLKFLKRHMHGFIASLLNIILHLQGPSIFYQKLGSTKSNLNPDPGAVVLMCVELLTKISRRYGQSQMDASHVGQSLRIPGALFNSFNHLRVHKEASISNQMICSLEKDNDLVMSWLLEPPFVINLYAACCRLLCTCVKHHQRVTLQCIALLQNSVEALLNCLELAGADMADKNDRFALNLEEGVLCATYLRRVYEEIRQQRDAFGAHCFLFLSAYISLYSGNGPQRKGLKREIDDALKPGVYALIDVCDDTDFQYIHTVFGEGPCRSTLANVRNNYKLNFQYQGKV